MIRIILFLLCVVMGSVSCTGNTPPKTSPSIKNQTNTNGGLIYFASKQHRDDLAIQNPYIVRFAGQQAAEGFAQPSVRGGLHPHVGGHPAHAPPLGEHGLAGLQLADHHRQRCSLDLIFHGVLLSLLGPGPVFSILPGPLHRVNPNRAAKGMKKIDAASS